MPLAAAVGIGMINAISRVEEDGQRECMMEEGDGQRECMMETGWRRRVGGSRSEMRMGRGASKG